MWLFFICSLRFACIIVTLNEDGNSIECAQSVQLSNLYNNIGTMMLKAGNKDSSASKEKFCVLKFVDYNSQFQERLAT